MREYIDVAVPRGIMDPRISARFREALVRAYAEGFMHAEPRVGG